MLILKLGTASLIAVFCVTGIHSETEEPESCFLYPANINHTIFFKLKNLEENYVTINRLFDRRQKTTILNENNHCVLSLVYETRADDNCPMLQFKEEYTTLGFRKRGDHVFVNVKSGNEIQLNISLTSIHIETEEPVNVAFDCPGNCFQFHHALIHATPKGNESSIHLKIYGLVEDQQKAIDSQLRFLRGNKWEDQSFGSLNEWELGKLSNSNWNIFDMNASYTESDYLNHKLNVSVTTPSLDKISPLHRPQAVESKDLYIDFRRSRGMRWALYCHPNAMVNNAQPQGHPTGLIEKKYFFILAAISGILMVTTVCLCCHICRQKAKQDTTHPDNSRQTDTAEHNDVANGENQQKAIYDYIDLQAFQKYLGRRFSRKSRHGKGHNNTDRPTLQSATSHTSINSIYEGYYSRT